MGLTTGEFTCYPTAVYICQIFERIKKMAKEIMTQIWMQEWVYCFYSNSLKVKWSPGSVATQRT